ncbi:Mrp/NBP35 family ATP-binding protein [Halalkalicoccus jeotgali]|uniref:Iron-sulfur cluster carrier protein n=1 Tax=Halalkalicoccus jeotgali (strain DSM 18796 / CECT 7217 / JCM 14584 / KCTC 4019 / B3) TaxID=795797 RepID=D8J335_HALJB|nr:Mrp/NBP35 family ATP-binding protein [Halalkalicoccus jeotgali]ADJ15142.1 ATP-binding protein Mrp 1 [Halalkalicoccus jeotgali B3]ELY35138.1 ATP-binding protein Mrp 1 [Halalkalicoccus jeotgali B3]
MDDNDVLDRLRSVEDPDLGDDIVSLGLVNEVSVDPDRISISLALGAPYSPTETQIAADVRETLSDLDREIDLSARVESGLSADEQVLPNVENVIAVSSGKGGVGKSTVAVNLAAGLSQMGARVGLFDADIYGPNVPRMVDADQRPQATEEEVIIPPEKFGMKLMSMDFLVGKDDPVIWRGPMVHKVLTQLWEDVEWGHLDYMIVDLPPGTGDAQLTLLQSVPVTGAVIVTTPQDVAIDDANKGLRMFGRHDTVVLGIAENMSGFICPDCGSEHEIFGKGGGKAFAQENELPYLGGIPLDPSVRTGGDEGKPIVLDSDSETGNAFRVLTENVANNIGVTKRQQQSQR